MPSSDVSECLEQISLLQTRLLARQRALKSRRDDDPEKPIDAGAETSIVLDALQQIAKDRSIDSVTRLNLQTQCLTSLALLFLLVRLEKTSGLSSKQATDSVDLVWSLWPPQGSGLTILRCKEVAANALRLPRGSTDASERLLSLCAQAPLATKRTLYCLQELLDAGFHEAVQQVIPDLDLRCLDLLGHPEVSTPAGRLCMSLISFSVSPEADDFGKWIERIRDALLLGDLTSKQSASKHLMPLIAKIRPRLFRALFSSIALEGSQHLETFMSIAHSGFSTSLLKRTDLPDELMLAASQHRNPSLRAAVLVLLSDAPSTALRLTSVDLDIISDFMQYDMGPSDPDFRQVTAAAWLRLLVRLRTSAYAADRVAHGARKYGTPDADAEIYVENVRRLLEASVFRFKKALLPCSPYRMQRGALQLLSTLLASGLDETYRGERDKSVHKTLQQFKSQPTAGKLWPFTVKVCDRHMSVHLTRCLLSTYDDVRDAAFALLLDFPRPLPGFTDAKDIDNRIFDSAMVLLRNRRESESTSGALLTELAWRLHARDDDAVLLRILDASEEDIGLSERDLKLSAQTNPMHGCLTAARQMIVAMLRHGAPIDKGTYSRILRLVERVWQIVKPILCHASPEGIEIDGLSLKDGTDTIADNEDARALHHLGDLEADIDDEDDIEDAAGPTHKILLSATWRAAKESAALLEAAIATPALNSRLQDRWDLSELKLSCSLFSDWLLQIRHRGAFSAIYPGYGRLCRHLIEYKNWPQVQELPLTLLDGHVADLRHRRMSTTRRSAGLPFCILGALTGIYHERPDQVEHAVSTVLRIAEAPETPVDVRVHAFNTLMVLIGDSEIAPALALHIERCFAISVRHFSSDKWDLRNVSMLLFASLVQRTLGSRMNMSTLGVQRANKRVHSHEFFKKYPKLPPLLRSELKFAVENKLQDIPTLDMQSSLYSILLLLSLLWTPARVPGAYESSLQFVSLIDSCALSRVWRIRDAAAQAMVALLPPEDAIQLLSTWHISADMSNNELHGRILQILILLQRQPVTFDQASSFLARFDNVIALKLSDRPYPVLDAAINIVIVSCRLSGADKPSKCCPRLLALARVQQPSQINDPFLPGCDTFMKRCAQLIDLEEGSQGDGSSKYWEQSTVYGPESGAKKEVRLGTATTNELQPFPGTLCADFEDHTATTGLTSESSRIGLSGFQKKWTEFSRLSRASARHTCLPELARCASTQVEADMIMSVIDDFTQVHESEESRKAGVLSLRALPAALAQCQPAFSAILMRMLQEDELQIRTEAELVSHTAASVHGLRQLPKVANDLVGHLGADKVVAECLCGDIASLLKSLLEPDISLFARERANLFKDDVLELDILLQAALLDKTAVWSATSMALRQCMPLVQAFVVQQKLVINDALGPASKAAFALIALKLDYTLKVLGDAAPSDLPALVRDTGLAAGLE